MLAVIFPDDLRAEFSMAPCCLFAAVLTLPEITGRIQVDLLEIGFWFLFIFLFIFLFMFLLLFFHWRLKSVPGDAPGIIEKITEGCEANLYRMNHSLTLSTHSSH
jgi:heme/copper-type cytochrome/quinol oxidase subunit 2